MVVASAAIQAELERIADGGRLTASGVVRRARQKSSPLHEYFEWDDSVAAHQHRLWQARQLIKRITIVREEGAPAEPMYVHIRQQDQDQGREGYYAPIADLQRDEWAIAMEDARRRLDAARYAVDVLERYAKTTKRKSQVKAARKHLQRASEELVAVGA